MEDGPMLTTCDTHRANMAVDLRHSGSRKLRCTDMLFQFSLGVFVTKVCHMRMLPATFGQICTCICILYLCVMYDIYIHIHL
jgi:hypothetical protein